MKTITIQIGNSDDKLTQKEWAQFVDAVHMSISNRCEEMHFSGGSSNNAIWQNFAWVFTCQEKHIDTLKSRISAVGGTFKQDSVAWTEGETLFI